MDSFVVKKKRKQESESRDNESTTDVKFLKTQTDSNRQITFKNIRLENLSCDYGLLYSTSEANSLLKECEGNLSYNTDQLSRICLFGKWVNIPRKQVAHGDAGLSYQFSGNAVSARPWTPLLERIRDKITKETGHTFNFVLINRYKDGHDYIGEHKDDEKDLEPGHPIASLSLGQARDFVFKHQDSRGKNAKRSITPFKIELENGSLLLMNHPTNSFWYHSLPCRKKLTNVRINFTFRKMVVK